MPEIAKQANFQQSSLQKPIPSQESSKKQFEFINKWVILVTAVIVIILIGGFIIINNKIAKTSVTLNSQQKNDSDAENKSNIQPFLKVEEVKDNENYFITKLDFDSFQLENIPWAYGINSVWVDGNSTWVSSGDGILNFDTNSSQLKIFSDTSKFPCARPTLAVIKRSLFVACSGSLKQVKNDMNKKGIYEFDLDTMKLKRIVELSKDVQNLGINTDGEYVWGETFDGVFRYEPVSGKIKWYTRALKGDIKEVLQNEAFGSKIYIWGQEVWVIVSANAQSRGLIARYNRENDIWQAWGPNFFSKDASSIDLFPVGIINDGVWAGGKKFDFKSFSWTNTNTSPSKETGVNYLIKTVENINQEELFIKNPTTGSFQKLPFFFRSAWKSKRIGDKIYILTSHSIDVFTKEDAYPKVSKKLGFEINEQLEYLNFDIAEGENFAFAWYASSGMQAFDNVALIPLNESQKAIMDVQLKSKDYEISKLLLKRDGSNYYLFSNELNRNVYKIDTALRRISLIVN